MTDMRLSAPASRCEPIIFIFQGNPLRVLDREGNPWFVANDVVGGLGLSNKTEALRCLDDDERGSEILTSSGGPQQTTIISEPGFYKLVGRSRKPAAKRFDRWVRHEVLPTIRKTGGYRAQPTADDRFDQLIVVTEKLVDALVQAMAKPSSKKHRHPKDDLWTSTILEWANAQAEPFRLIEMFPAIAKRHRMDQTVSRKGHEIRIANILRANGYAKRMGYRRGCRKHTCYWEKTLSGPHGDLRSPHGPNHDRACRSGGAGHG